jgi:hypothetical protein
VDITSVDLRSPKAEEESRARVKLIVDSFEKQKAQLDTPISQSSILTEVLAQDRERGMSRRG